MKKFTYLLIVLLLALFVAPVLAQEDVVLARLQEYGSSLPKGYGLISVEDLSVLLAEQDVTLLDVRQPEEYEAGHLEGSFNVPIRDLAKNLALLPDKDAPIAVICKGGGRAMLAGVSLQVLGYTNVKILKGGYDAWVGEELPTTTEAFMPEAGTAPEFDAAILASVDTYLTNLPQGYGIMKATDLAAELADTPPILIDVRGQEEWDGGYIEGAQHIWINEFMARQSEWPADKNAPIVVYCASSYRGGIAAVMLNLMGYTNVRNLGGGINGWIAAELPVVGVPEQAAEAFNLETYLAEYVAGLPDTFNAVRAADLAEELKSGAELLLVDVRTADEYAEGFIEGAINIPLQELTLHLDMLPNLDQNMVIYCGSGHRSALAMTALNLLGYKNVRSLLGGVGAWTAGEFPLSDVPVEYMGGTAPAFEPAVFGLVNNFITSIPAGYYAVKADALNAELAESAPVLIDVRTQSEWTNGHLEGATFLTLRNFVIGMAQWPTDKAAAVVLYDNPTHRSSMALVFMRLMGYENVRVLAGGTGGWEKAGLPLVKE